jgi:Pyridine nucleotide-disulphide oxidoreductase
VTARHTRALVVVGGGVAGRAAAVEARRAGVSTCVVDSRPALRAPSELLAAFESSGAETWLGTTVWGIWGHDLALCGPRNQSTVLAFDQLIVATGAFERPVAFPGWTLPGVMTVGQAERLLDQGAVLGQRVLLAGYGRPVAAATADLRERAVNLVGVLSASATTGQVPVRAEGEGLLERIVVADVDANWYPRSGTEKVADIDAVVLALTAWPDWPGASIRAAPISTRPQCVMTGCARACRACSWLAMPAGSSDRTSRSSRVAWPDLQRPSMPAT